MVETRISNDKFLGEHKNYYLRLSRAVVYGQYLESYKTVKLEKMAHDFGVSVEFIDNELYKMIASRKLNCQIDKVTGIVESSKGDQRVQLFKEILRKGDNLVEKMYRVARTAQY